MQISKSEYMMFLKHPAWLWLKKHDKYKLPMPDANLQALFDEGNEFEKIAEGMFPEAVKLGFNGYHEYLDLPSRTKKEIESGTKTIFQGRVEAGNITCIIDVLDRVDDLVFDLYEIKSSTKVKSEHIDDLAFQVIVLESAGLKVNNISVAYVNNEYVRNGEVEPADITTTENISETVREKIDSTKENIKKAFDVIHSKECPDISPRYADNGSFEEWMDIYKKLVGGIEKYSIYNLAYPGAERIGKLEDLGVKNIADIPDDFELTPKQQWQVDAVKSGERYIDKESISEFLQELEYPLYFLDYETFSGVVPAFDGIRPYQQVPFQYSVHILDSPNSELRQAEYIHKENSNPAKEIASQLREDLGDSGSVIVWYEAFEKKCNEVLGDMVPEHRDYLLSVNSRIKDLMIPFSKGWFVDKDFFGSASIKNVLPVLVPELSYKELDVQDGQAAQRIWMDTVFKEKNGEDRDKVFENLLKYCGLDTLAMVEIFKVLK